MATSNSSYTPWDRLYDAITAVHALSEIFCISSPTSGPDVDAFVSVFGYMGTALREDRDNYLESLAANCQADDAELDGALARLEDARSELQGVLRG